MKQQIAFYREINDLNRDTHFPEMTDLPLFFILEMQDSGADFVKMMPPYVQDFFQIGFQYQMTETKFSLQSKVFNSLQNLLYMVAPGQVMSWIVEKQNYGYILYFKRDFISSLIKDPENMLPFFNILERSLFELEEEDAARIYRDLGIMRLTYKTKSPYRQQLLQGQLYAFLFLCLQISESFKKQEEKKPRSTQTAIRFQQLLNNLYIKHTTLEEYAELLHITPNYLSSIIKKTFGKKAKSMMNERLIAECKNLLTYSDSGVSEIAYQLGFSEPSHFGRFFKSETGLSPGEFRNKVKV